MAGKNSTTPEGMRRGTSLNVYLPGDMMWLKQALEERAHKERRSVSEVVLFILEESLDGKSKRRR